MEVYKLLGSRIDSPVWMSYKDLKQLKKSTLRVAGSPSIYYESKILGISIELDQ